MKEEVTHDTIYQKLVEHEGKILKITDDVHDLGQDVHGIKVELEPIATGVKSMAWSFKGLLVLGAGSAALVGILELLEHFK